MKRIKLKKEEMKTIEPVGFCDVCNFIILSNQKWRKIYGGKIAHVDCLEQIRRKSLRKLGVK